MQNTLLSLALALGMVGAEAKAQPPPPPAPKAEPAVTLKNDDDKTLYALGAIIGKSLANFNLNKTELELVKKGLTDQTNGAKLQINPEEYNQKIEALAKARGAIKAEQEKAKSQDYLAAAAKEKGAVKTPSGMVFIEMTPGKGEAPKATDTVKVHYKGTLTDGTEFDSSYRRNQPAEFPLNGVIPCWTEGVQKMKLGGKAKLVCPSSIAYGDQGRPPKIPGGATLVFEIELLEVVKKP